MKPLAFACMITVSAIPLAWGQALHPVDKAEVECLRVVIDPDGTANVRSDPSLDAKVTGKVKSGTVVSIFEVEGDWTMLQSQGNYPGQNEYMHTSRLKTLDDWKEARPKKTTFKRGTVENGGVKVEVVAEPWEKAKHKVTKDPDRGMLVDGHGIQGTDGNLPSHAIVLQVTINGKDAKVPASATHDLYEPNMDSLKLITPGNPAEQMAITMQNSDGAGFYHVAWSFVEGKYAGRTVFYLSRLPSMAIPEGRTSIGEDASPLCKGPTSVTTPDSVTSIGDEAFSDCSGLTAVVFLGDAPTVGKSCFDGTDPGFSVFYLSGSVGFTSPKWLGYPAQIKAGE